MARTSRGSGPLGRNYIKGRGKNWRAEQKLADCWTDLKIGVPAQ